MILCLGLITLAAAAGLSSVHKLTTTPIERAKAAKTTVSLKAVMPEFDEVSEPREVILDEMPILVYTGTLSGAVSGYAVQTITKRGFSGEVRLMVGFTPEGTVNNVAVLQQNETPGLGSKMADADNPLIKGVQGKNPATANLTVRKDGGEVDAITAATISSRAYLDAIARAHRAFVEATGGEAVEGASGATDSTSGATTTDEATPNS